MTVSCVGHDTGSTQPCHFTRNLQRKFFFHLAPLSRVATVRENVRDNFFRSSQGNLSGNFRCFDKMSGKILLRLSVKIRYRKVREFRTTVSVATLLSIKWCCGPLIMCVDDWPLTVCVCCVVQRQSSLNPLNMLLASRYLRTNPGPPPHVSQANNKE